MTDYKKKSFSTTISKFLEIAIELRNRWQFSVTVSHHQTVNKRTFKIPKGRTYSHGRRKKNQFIVKENTALVL